MFRSRTDAGERLGERLARLDLKLVRPVVLGLARGGVAVGYEIAKRLGAELGVLVVRKLSLAYEPEAGWGAITVDGVAVFGEAEGGEVVDGGEETKGALRSIIDEAYGEVKRRHKLYYQGKEKMQIRGRSVVVADDGVAAGYTMLAAIRYVKKEGAREVIVAAGVAHQLAYGKLREEAQTVVVIEVENKDFFSVGAHYKDFHQMSDEQVMEYLSRARAERAVKR